MLRQLNGYDPTPEEEVEARLNALVRRTLT
jgi:hypothetical protein